MKSQEPRNAQTIWREKKSGEFTFPDFKNYQTYSNQDHVVLAER